jgi:hypothetical protein
MILLGTDYNMDSPQDIEIVATTSRHCRIVCVFVVLPPPSVLRP